MFYILQEKIVIIKNEKVKSLERIEGIEPSRAGRKHASLPLTYIRIGYKYIRQLAMPQVKSRGR